MNDWRHSIALTMIALSLLSGLAFADVKVSLKIQGGWAYISGGDVIHGTQAFFDWGELYFAPPSGGRIEGGYTPLHRGYEVGGDLIFELTRTVGIAIGAGYLQMSRALRDSKVEIHYSLEGYRYQITDVSELKAIPIRLGLLLALPISRKLDITANAGLSWYLRARYHADWYVGLIPPISLDMDPYQKISTTAEQKKFPLGFQVGVGIEYKLLPRIGLFVEARGRYARFRSLEGTSTSEPGEWGGLLPSFSENGKLYYESVPMLPDAPRIIMVQSLPPPGPGAEARMAVVDFSGVTLQAGIRVRL
jgi:hypothetical protein